MTDYNPPLEQLSIFNGVVFSDIVESVKYPVAQGQETLPSLVVQGNTYLNNATAPTPTYQQTSSCATTAYVKAQAPPASSTPQFGAFTLYNMGGAGTPYTGTITSSLNTQQLTYHTKAVSFSPAFANTPKLLFGLGASDNSGGGNFPSNWNGAYNAGVEFINGAWLSIDSLTATDFNLRLTISTKVNGVPQELNNNVVVYWIAIP